MLKAGIKRMWNYIDSNLLHYSVLIVMLGGVLTIFGGIIQYRKELVAAEDALKVEKRRVAEHVILQDKSNCILDSTSKVLGDTKDLLKDTDKLLLDTRELLTKADSTLAGQTDMIESQNALINRQNSTLQYLSGTDSIPMLILRSQDYLKSFTDYQLYFLIKIDDEFPIRDLKLTVMMSTDEEFNHARNKIKTENNRKEYVIELEQKNRFEGPFTVYQGKPTSIKELMKKFPTSGDERTFFSIFLKWPKGSYSVSGDLFMNENFESSFNIEHLSINDTPIYSNHSDYFKYDKGIGPRTQEILKMNRFKDAYERNLLNSKDQNSSH